MFWWWWRCGAGLLCDGLVYCCDLGGGNVPGDGDEYLNNFHYAAHDADEEDDCGQVDTNRHSESDDAHDDDRERGGDAADET